MFVDDGTITRECLVERDAVLRQSHSRPASRRLRSSIGTRLIASPFTSSRSNAQRTARASVAWPRIRFEHCQAVVVADDGLAVDHA
jgi:hypothetical protein